MTHADNEMIVLGHNSACPRLYWDEFWHESCPWCRIDRSTCWPAVQRATTVPRMPQTYADICCYLLITAVYKCVHDTDSSTQTSCVCNINMAEIMSQINVSTPIWCKLCKVKSWPSWCSAMGYPNVTLITQTYAPWLALWHCDLHCGTLTCTVVLWLALWHYCLHYGLHYGLHCGTMTCTVALWPMTCTMACTMACTVAL